MYTDILHLSRGMKATREVGMNCPSSFQIRLITLVIIDIDKGNKFCHGGPSPTEVQKQE